MVSKRDRQILLRVEFLDGKGRRKHVKIHIRIKQIMWACTQRLAAARLLKICRLHM